MRGGRHIEVHMDNTPSVTGTEEDRRLSHLQQLQADLLRVRRRIEEAHCQVGLTLFEPLLAVIEDLRRTLKDGTADVAQLRMTLDDMLERLLALMEEQGVERIPSAGEPFDPEVHEAVIAERRGEYSKWQVVEELEVGYRFRGRLIRPSKVRVVR